MSFSTVIFSDQIEAKLLRYRISKINEYPIKSDERIILKNNNGQIVEGIFKEIDINQNIIIFDLKKEKTSILPLKDFRNYYK